MDDKQMLDPIALVKEEQYRGTVEEDPVRPGYFRYTMTAAERALLEARFSVELRQTLRDYEPLLKKRAANFAAYEAESKTDQAITIPVSKRDINQQIAWQVETLLSKRPYISVKPLEEGTLEGIANDEDGVPQQVALSTEEWAKELEDWLDFKLRHRLDWERIVTEYVTEAHIDGTLPALIKVWAEDGGVTVRQRALKKKKGAFGNETPILSVEESKVMRGERVKIGTVPGDRFFMPVDDVNPQTARWIAERLTGVDATEIRRKIANGTYDFCRAKDDAVTEDELTAIIGAVGEERPDVGSDIRTSDVPPPGKPEVIALHFFHPVLQDDDGQKVISIYDMSAHFELTTGKFLCCYINEYWHSKREYVPLFLRQRPHRFTGCSPVEDAAPFQRIISSIFHLQLQNMVQQNVKVFLVRNNSVTHTYLTNNPKRRPGEAIPYETLDDVSAQPLGGPVQPLSNEIMYLSGESEKITMVNQYDRGAIPGRTAAAAISQSQELAKMQPAQIRRVIRRALSEAILLYVQTASQFIQEDKIPWYDPEKRRRAMRVMKFPRQMIEGQVAFEIAASDEDDSVEAAFEKSMIVRKEVSAQNQERMTLLAGIYNPGTPPPMRESLAAMLAASELALSELIRLTRKDADKYVLDMGRIHEGIAQMEALAQQQQQMAAAAQGDANGQPVSDAGPAEGVPPPTDGGGGMGPMAGLPPDAGGAVGPAPQDLLAAAAAGGPSGEGLV